MCSSSSGWGFAGLTSFSSKKRAGCDVISSSAVGLSSSPKSSAIFTGAAAALRIVGTSSTISFRLRNNVRCTNRGGIHYRYSSKESTQHCNNKTRQKNPSLSLVAIWKTGHCAQSFCHLQSNHKHAKHAVNNEVGF